MGVHYPRPLTVVGISALMLAASCADAKRFDALSFDLPAQPLSASLHEVAARAHVSIAAPADLLDAHMAPQLVGRMTADQAVDRLLQGSGLRARAAGDAIVIESGAAGPGPAAMADELLVTGTRIRGAAVASTVIRTTRDDIRNLGLTDLGQVIRSIPQSYGGGQNPGVGQAVPSASGSNTGGGSSINLRGLGSDATLTLLNGHRLPYAAALQSVDVSVIPVQILDRIEIVPDGASALYGSDAVAGVANIILKRDYDGLESNIVLGTATDGGDFQQQYGLLGGKSWAGGGFAVAYEYGHTSEISADDRDYGAGHPALTLMPRDEHHNVVASAHQRLGGGLTASLDGFYNVRWSGNFFPTGPAAAPASQISHFVSKDRAYALSPSLDLALPADWRLALSASLGREKVDYSQTACKSGGCTSNGAGFYRNDEHGAELSADGPVARLQGGTVKLAAGAGVHHIGFRRFNGMGSLLNTNHGQSDYYAFGEVSLPFVGTGNCSRLVRSLVATAAIRYERYPGIGAVATPKLGLVYGITDDLDLRGSWGKSFRAPTLYQEYQPRSIYLYPPAALGGQGYSAAASTLVVLGGNPALRPERADTWSAGADIHPHILPGLDIGVSYFSVHYKDRIVTPIEALSVALADPGAAGQVMLNPTADAIAATLAEGTFSNFTGEPFDPAHVVAIVDDASVNAGRFIARGMDIQARYATKAGAGEVGLSSDVAYLVSRRQLTTFQPLVPLAGKIFNPPHWRGRATASWSVRNVAVAATVNVAQGLSDNRYIPNGRERGMTSLDLTSRLRPFEAVSPLGGLELSVSVLNLFNRKPGLMRTTYAFEQPYDSTNYSPVGRFVSFGIRTSW